VPFAEQELVAHLFAPLDGPHAALARQQLLTIWDACGTELRMTEPVPGVAAAPGEIPLTAGLDGPLAARQDAGADFQAILRREHDVLNLSVVFAAPLDTAARRRRIGSAAAPGWYEFLRWWQTLAAGGTGALLGVNLVFQAKAEGPEVDLAGNPPAALPAGLTDAPTLRTGELNIWDPAAAADADRQLVVLTGFEQELELSTFTWSDGRADLPPLGRYLMHAAKLRYESRVLGEGSGRLMALSDRVDRRLNVVTRRLQDAANPDGSAPESQPMAADEALLISTLADLRRMARTVDIALGNMGRATTPFPADARTGEWLRGQLADTTDYLEATLQKSQRVRSLLADRPPVAAVPSVLVTPVPPAPPAAGGPVQLRMGFAIDVVGYSGRSAHLQTQIQQRIADLVVDVLGDLELRLPDTDHQGTGDGMNVFLPATVELPRALPRLLNGWHRRLALDNQRFPDRVRLRLATAVGMFAPAAIGFAGDTIIEVSRLLNSEVLRETVDEWPDADLVALVSDQLYGFVDGWPGLEPDQFERRSVRVKAYVKEAWLWLGTRPPKAGDE